MKNSVEYFSYFMGKIPLCSTYMCLNLAEGVTDINCKIMSLIRPRKSPIISNSFMELKQRCYTTDTPHKRSFLITISSELKNSQQKSF